MRCNGLRSPRGTTLHLGNALAARLYASLLARNVDVLFGDERRAAVDRRRCRQRRADQGCIRQPADRRAQGRGAGDRRLLPRYAASRAVLSCRRGMVSATAPGGTGDGLHAAIAAGASINTRVASPAYWVPASLFQARRRQPGRFPAYRDRPGKTRRHCGQCVGKALCQRSLVLPRVCPRHAARWQRRDEPFILSRLRSAFSLDLRTRPHQAFHDACQAVRQKRRIDRGAEHRCAGQGHRRRRNGARDDREELQCPCAGKGSTRNSDAGRTIYQRHLGDAGHSPNPCVAPIERAPFYALRIYPADLGTAIGLRTDCHARVLSKDGSRHCRPLCLRQRYGLDHERQLSGARHHARAGPDIRLHRRPALAQIGEEGNKHEKRRRAGFGVNTYSYIFGGSAADTVARLADQGYGGVELMFFPGHLWPAELDASALRSLRNLCEERLRLVAVNMPNVDMNVAAAAEEMRAYTLDLLVQVRSLRRRTRSRRDHRRSRQGQSAFSDAARSHDLLFLSRARHAGAAGAASRHPAFDREHAVRLPARRGVADECCRWLWRRQHSRDLRRGERALHRRSPDRRIAPRPRAASAWCIFPIRPGRVTSTIRWGAEMFRSRAFRPS